MPSLIEEITTNLCEATFFRELSFSGQKFAVKKTGEFELADEFVWLESEGIIIHVKERDQSEPVDQVALENWFEKKVQRKASAQIADTLSFFNKYPSITVKNARGLDFELRELNVAMMHKLVVFGTLADGADQRRLLKFRTSQHSGFIHLIQANDFSNLLKWTVTPGEMVEYLRFRQTVLQSHENMHKRREKWLFGCFLSWGQQGDGFELPNESDGEMQVDRLVDDTADIDLSEFFDSIGSWAIGQSGDPKVFQKLVLECGHLPRVLMREFKRRVMKCLERFDQPIPDTLYRIVNPQRNCVFVFGVMPTEKLARVEIGASNITALAKYDCETEKGIGFFFTRVDDKYTATTPVYLESPWQYDSHAAEALAKFSPFRPLKAKPIEHYQFRNQPKP
jgi:hypothetical protein